MGLERLAMVAPALALIAWGMFDAVSTARVDGILRRIDATVADSRATDKDWPVVRHQLRELGGAGLSNPATHELLGVVAVRGNPGPEGLAEGIEHFSNAIRLRPISGYTWVNLAGAKYQLGDTGRLFEFSLRRAAELAPHEPAVQALVAHFGLAVWDEVSPETRAAIQRMLLSGMRRNPLETLHIAARRGRLDVACRHVADVARHPDPKWSGICQISEARQ